MPSDRNLPLVSYSEIVPKRVERALVQLVPLIGYFLMQGLLLTDVIQRGTGFSKAGVVSLLASLTVWFLFCFARELDREGSLHIESHWGGLGGGVGGFRISRSILYLTGAICFGMLLVLAYYPPQFLTQVTKPSSSQTSQKTEAVPMDKKSPQSVPEEQKK